MLNKVILLNYNTNSMSFECPLKYNPADYYIEVLASKVNKKSNLEKIKVISIVFPIFL